MLTSADMKSKTKKESYDITFPISPFCNCFTVSNCFSSPTLAPPFRWFFSILYRSDVFPSIACLINKKNAPQTKIFKFAYYRGTPGKSRPTKRLPSSSAEYMSTWKYVDCIIIFFINLHNLQNSFARYSSKQIGGIVYSDKYVSNGEN